VADERTEKWRAKQGVERVGSSTKREGAGGEQDQSRYILRVFESIEESESPAPGVADQHGALDPELPQRSMKEAGLPRDLRERTRWPLAIAVPRPVERQHSEVRCEWVDEAGREVVHKPRIAVEEHHGLPRTGDHVVESHSLHRDETADRRERPLGTAALELGVKRGQS
jgi:hypothetical protein